MHAGAKGAKYWRWKGAVECVVVWWGCGVCAWAVCGVVGGGVCVVWCGGGLQAGGRVEGQRLGGGRLAKEGMVVEEKERQRRRRNTGHGSASSH